MEFTPGGGKLRLSSNVLARDVAITFEDPDVRPSDNFFDLIPGKPVYISLPGKDDLKGLKPHVMSLTDALSRP